MAKSNGKKPGKKAVQSGKSGAIMTAPYVNEEITEIVYERGRGFPFKHQTSTIAFISGKISSSFIPTVTRGVEERIKELGRARHSLFFQSPRNGTSEEAGREIMSIINKKSADGIIVLSLTPEQGIIDNAIKSGIPMVFIERQIKGLSSVKVDNFKGGYLAARHLIKSGRKKPGVIIDAHTSNPESAEYERLRGFKAGLKESGIPFPAENMVKAGLNTVEAGRISLEKFGKKLKKLDSIFSVAGDDVAIGFMIEAKSLGIKIPRDLAIIGFDDMDVAAAVEPALTTIRQPIEGMGKEAVNIIDEAINGKLKGPKNIILDPELIIRESV